MKKLLILLFLPLLSIAQTKQNEASLLVYYSFNANAIDRSRYNLDAEIYNGSYCSNNFGSENNELHLDGMEDRLILPPLDFSDNLEQTISIWINPYGIKRDYCLISYANTKHFPWNQYELYVENHQLHYLVRNPQKREEIVSLDFVPANHQWVHILASKDKKGIMSLYVDGVKKASLQAEVGFCKIVKNSKTVVGASYGENYSDYFGGIIDEIKIYKRALSEAEAQDIYANGGSNHFVPVYDENQNSPFVLFNQDDNFLYEQYCEQTKQLFLLKAGHLKVYSLANIHALNDFQEDISLNFSINNQKNLVGLVVNKSGTYAAILDDHQNIKIIDLSKNEVAKTIKIPKSLYNYFGRIRDDYQANPFAFVGEDKLLVAGNQYAYIVNILSLDMRKFHMNDGFPSSSVSSIYTVSKLCDNGQAISYHLDSETSKTNELIVEDDQFVMVCHPNENIIQQKNGHQIFHSFENISDQGGIANYVCNPIKLTGEEKYMKIAHIAILECIDDGQLLLGLKEDNKGFVIFDYLLLEQEVEKQYFINSKNNDAAFNIEDFKALYPQSKYMMQNERKLVEY